MLLIGAGGPFRGMRQVICFCCNSPVVFKVAAVAAVCLSVCLYVCRRLGCGRWPGESIFGALFILYWQFWPADKQQEMTFAWRHKSAWLKS